MTQNAPVDQEVVLVRTPREIEQTRDLLREYSAWVVTLEEGSVCAPPLQGLHGEIEDLPGIYTPPKGRLLLALKDGEAAGCIGLKPRSTELCEVKRLYVRPSYRGHKLGELLLGRLLEEARAAGYQRIILDSHISMKSAHRLYEWAGFQYVEPFADFPADLAPVAVFMEKKLA